jgi:hypothetical protein
MRNINEAIQPIVPMNMQISQQMEAMNQIRNDLADSLWPSKSPCDVPWTEPLVDWEETPHRNPMGSMKKPLTKPPQMA